MSIHLPTTIHQRCLLFNIYNSHYFHPIILIYYSTWLYHLYLLSECSFVSTAHQLAGMFTPHIYSNHSHLCQWCVTDMKSASLHLTGSKVFFTGTALPSPAVWQMNSTATSHTLLRTVSRVQVGSRPKTHCKGRRFLMEENLMTPNGVSSQPIKMQDNSMHRNRDVNGLVLRSGFSTAN